MGKQQQPVSSNEELRRLTAEAHVAIKDLRTVMREVDALKRDLRKQADVLRTAVQHNADNIQNLVENLVDPYIRETLKARLDSVETDLVDYTKRQFAVLDRRVSELCENVFGGAKDGPTVGRLTVEELIAHAKVEMVRGKNASLDSFLTDIGLEFAKDITDIAERHNRREGRNSSITPGRWPGERGFVNPRPASE